MLEFKRFNNILKLSVLFSFFLFNLSWFISNFLTNLKDLFVGTFLETLNSLIIILNDVFFAGLQFISLIFFVLALITLILVFLFDILLNKEVRFT